MPRGVDSDDTIYGDQAAEAATDGADYILGDNGRIDRRFTVPGLAAMASQVIPWPNNKVCTCARLLAILACMDSESKSDGLLQLCLIDAGWLFLALACYTETGISVTHCTRTLHRARTGIGIQRSATQRPTRAMMWCAS